MSQSEIAARLQTEVIAAMKARQKERLGVLRMLQAAIKQVEVDERRELSDADVARVLSSYSRKVKDQIKSYGDGGRADLLAAAEAEMAVVAEFLPAELTDAELAILVQEVVAETGANQPRDMGQVMKVLLPKVVGRADGGRVSALVKAALQNGD